MSTTKEHPKYLHNYLTLPVSQEACTLVTPNVHVMSEEIKAKIEDEKNKLMRMVRV